MRRFMFPIINSIAAVSVFLFISVGTEMEFISRNGKAKNPVLREYYLKKCDSKPKLVAMGAVSHKVCNMIFAILRDNKPFKIIAPQEHIKQYNSAKCNIAA